MLKKFRVIPCLFLLIGNLQHPTRASATRRDAEGSLRADLAGKSGMVIVDRGKASYYAGKFRNRRTASGERYHPDLFTAAHRTLPFGSTIVVKRSGTGKCVLVRINDRGPFVKGRVVDLSRAAARFLNLTRPGIANVEVYVVPRGARRLGQRCAPPPKAVARLESRR